MLKLPHPEEQAERNNPAGIWFNVQWFVVFNNAATLVPVSSGWNFMFFLRTLRPM
jgi:hypothetical protein